MKKIITITLTILLVCGIFPGVAASENIGVTINGVKTDFDTKPIILNGRTMVPMRGIFEKLGAEVLWDGETQTVTAKREGNEVTFKIGESVAKVNGEQKNLDQSAIIDENNRTLVPLRFVGESFDTVVEWDEQRRVAGIWDTTQEVFDSLKRFDSLMSEDVIDWLIGLWDPEVGGFYYSNSARDNEGFLPDLESTWQVITIIQDGGMISSGDSPEMPREIKEKMVKFASDMQSDEDGYFYHPQWAKEDMSLARLERDASWGRGIITKFGHQPKYKLPAERLQESTESEATQAASAEKKSSALPERYQSEENFRAWLDSLSWNDGAAAYSTANMFASSIGTISAAGFSDIAVEYVASKQNPETGLWSDELSTKAMNAAMKACSVFSKKHPYPNIDKMIQSVITILEKEAPYSASSLWNPADLIVNARATYGNNLPPDVKKKLDEYIPTLIDTIYNNAAVFKKKDGGFSYYPGNSSATSQSAKVSLGLAEGDVNATLLATGRIRTSCYKLAGLTPAPIYDVYRDKFMNALLNAKPVVKVVPPEPSREVTENFDEMEIGKDPVGWTAGKTSGDITISKDPHFPSNKVLKISTVPGGNTKASLQLNVPAQYEKATLEYRFNLMEGAPFSRWFTSLGDIAQDTFFDGKGKSSGTFTIHNRSGEAGKMGDLLAQCKYDEWYTLKIEYTPGGEETKVVAYIDGEKVAESATYYDMQKGKDPLVKLNSLSFTAFSDTGGEMYIDDIKLTIE